MFKLLIVTKKGVTQWSGHNYSKEWLADQSATQLLAGGNVEHIYLCIQKSAHGVEVVKQYA